MIHQTDDRVALVAGAALGMGAGTLAGFLVCSAGRTVARYFVHQGDDQLLHLTEPVPLASQRGAQPANLTGGASVTHLECDPSARMVPWRRGSERTVVSAR
jgi:NAD(P)-dependent dehydrogenase (short-subunit alcohol dehydrogenase family)